MPIQYPAAIDTANIPVLIDNFSAVNAASVNILRSAIIAIEQTLGVAPQSIYGTVVVRLNTLEAILNTFVPSVGTSTINFGSQNIVTTGSITSGPLLSTS